MPTTLSRQLRTGLTVGVEHPHVNNLHCQPFLSCFSVSSQDDPESMSPPQTEGEDEDEGVEALTSISLSFTAPEGLSRPVPADPLRIFVRLLFLQTH